MPETIGLSAKQRRAALDVSSRNRLGHIAERFEPEVAVHRVAANHAGEIVRARRVEFAELLGLLSRDEFKAMCEALGRDTCGREKQAFIDRILSVDDGTSAKGSGTSMETTTGKATERRSSTAFVAALDLDLDPNAKLRREQFEGYRWAVADILRGSVGGSDPKKNAQRTGEGASP